MRLKLDSHHPALQIKTENNVATLSFTEVYPVDAGKYTVLVRNAVGECQSECVVTVKVGLSIIIQKDPYQATARA